MSTDTTIPAKTAVPPEASAEAAAAPRRRLRIRYLVTGLVVLLLLLVAGWTGLTHWQLVSSSNRFDDGDYAGSEAAAQRFLAMSPFEDH
jgi:hypothetical protein